MTILMCCWCLYEIKTKTNILLTYKYYSIYTNKCMWMHIPSYVDISLCNCIEVILKFPHNFHFYFINMYLCMYLVCNFFCFNFYFYKMSIANVPNLLLLFYYFLKNPTLLELSKCRLWEPVCPYQHLFVFSSLW